MKLRRFTSAGVEMASRVAAGRARRPAEPFTRAAKMSHYGETFSFSFYANLPPF